jgi:signal transduction histidine kinase
MDGRLIQTNRAFREQLAAEHLSGFDAMSFADRAPLLHLRYAATGEPFPVGRHPVARALRGEVVAGTDAEAHWHLQAFDGHEVEVDVSAAPLHDGDGRIVGAVSVVRDVTERKQLEREREAARVQAERRADELDRIFEAVTDGLVVWDAEGRIVRDNAAGRRMVGLDAAPPGFFQLSAHEQAAFFAGRDEQGRPVPPEESPISRALRGEVGIKPEARDLRIRVLDGREIEANLSAVPLRDREGHLVGAVSVLHDQTERNRLARDREAARAEELAAREASRRLEAFLAVAAHDLRTPLTAVVGYLALAGRQAERLAAAAHAVREEHPVLAAAVAAVRGSLDDADAGAARLARLLSLLFDTSALRADKLELHRTPCDLAALVRARVEEQRMAAPGRAMRLHLPAHGAPVLVEADADRLGQVLSNYLTNALKYAPADQQVDVSVAVEETPGSDEGEEGSRGWARVAVRDRGPGLPAAERGRVWELFHRAPGIEAQGRAAGGGQGVAGGSLGLGLSISKAIVEAHGGRVGVESAPSRGSTFWFTLPLVEHPI